MNRDKREATMGKIDIDALIERLETGEPTANLYIVAALRQQQAEIDSRSVTIGKMAKENEELRRANESFAVCQKHIPEATSGDCLVCEIEELREQVERMKKKVSKYRDGKAARAK